MLVHQILLHGHGVAAQAQLHVDEGAVRFALGGGAGCHDCRRRWRIGGDGGGICSGGSVFTSGCGVT